MSGKPVGPVLGGLLMAMVCSAFATLVFTNLCERGATPHAICVACMVVFSTSAVGAVVALLADPE